MVSNQEVYDITIIGGGPVGLFTAFYAGMRQATVKIIESLPQLGGQLAALYPDKYIYDIAGFPKIKARDLVRQLCKQMQQFDNEVCLNEEVLEISKVKNIFKIRTSKQLHYSKTIIITAGSGAFKPRKMNIVNEERFMNKNLHYYINDINKFKDREVAILGGGDSAVDWALALENIARKVVIVHRRNKFRAHEYSVELLKKSTVRVLTPYFPISLKGDLQIESMVVKNTKEDIDLELNMDDYLVNYGFISNLGPVNNWNLEIRNSSILVNSKAETSLPGIYAVGDISTYDGKVKLMATGFGEAPIAVSNAKVFIDPNESIHTAHSTSIMNKLVKESKKAVIN